MRSRLLFAVLLLASVMCGRRDPAPPNEFIGTSLGINKVKTINIAAVINSLISGVTVLISWISFLIPPSNVKGRITVLMTTFIVKMSIINNVFTSVTNLEEATTVSDC